MILLCFMSPSRFCFKHVWFNRSCLQKVMCWNYIFYPLSEAWQSLRRLIQPSCTVWFCCLCVLASHRKLNRRAVFFFFVLTLVISTFFQPCCTCTCLSCLSIRTIVDWVTVLLLKHKGFRVDQVSVWTKWENVQCLFVVFSDWACLF